MSVIVTEVYDALVAAGSPEEKARAAAGVIPMTETLSTKQDFAEFRGEMKEDFAEFKGEMREEFAEFRAEMKADFAEFRTEMREEFAEFKAEMKGEFAEFRAEVKEEINPLKRDVAVLKLAMVSFMPAILALLAKLVFFP